MIEAARPYLLRILGPNCVGLLVPGLGINASFAHTAACPGKIAFVTQSGGMVTAVLDWAKSRTSAFRTFISLGNSADVDFGDVWITSAATPRPASILLYIESITRARASSCRRRGPRRATSRSLSSRRACAEGARGRGFAHRRAGGRGRCLRCRHPPRRHASRRRDRGAVLRVETLARARPLRGERLAILTNGGGPGVMADRLPDRARRATRSAFGRDDARLDAVLPATWSHGNPVDIIGDAPASATWRRAILSTARSAMPCWSCMPRRPSCRASACRGAPVLERHASNVLASWLGETRSTGPGASSSRRAFPPTTRRRMPSAPSCTWSTTGATRTAHGNAAIARQGLHAGYGAARRVVEARLAQAGHADRARGQGACWPPTASRSSRPHRQTRARGRRRPPSIGMPGGAQDSVAGHHATSPTSAAWRSTWSTRKRSGAAEAMLHASRD